MGFVLVHQIAAYSASNNTQEDVPAYKNVLRAAVGRIASCSLAVLSQPILHSAHEQYLHTKTTKTSENFRTAAILNCPHMHENA